MEKKEKKRNTNNIQKETPYIKTTRITHKELVSLAAVFNVVVQCSSKRVA